jgi:hypothetical protein
MFGWGLINIGSSNRSLIKFFSWGKYFAK